jgi:hypothetical protein
MCSVEAISHSSYVTFPQRWRHIWSQNDRRIGSIPLTLIWPIAVPQPHISSQLRQVPSYKTRQSTDGCLGSKQKGMARYSYCLTEIENKLALLILPSCLKRVLWRVNRTTISTVPSVGWELRDCSYFLSEPRQMKAPSSSEKLTPN